MKRIAFVVTAIALSAAQAHASAGFSCEADDKNVETLLVEGATPRSGGALINFGAILEIGGKKIEFKQPDVKRYYGVGGVIQVRVAAQSGDQSYVVVVNAKRNPKDEDDWGGTYEVTQTAADKKTKAAKVTRGKVKCSVE
jgi:imidazole glycerol phosphate synthase subunit HisF